jgi:hypothetical protein
METGACLAPRVTGATIGSGLVVKLVSGAGRAGPIIVSAPLTACNTGADFGPGMRASAVRGAWDF